MNDKELLRRMRAAEFCANNGRVLRTINILRHRYRASLRGGGRVGRDL